MEQLFVAYRLYRLDGHGAVGRREARQHAEGDEQHAGTHGHAEADLIVRLDDTLWIGRRLEHLEHQHGQRNTRHACHGSQHHALGEYLLENVARTGSDGTSDAYLGGAFAHGDHHDVRHADGSCKERAQPHHPDEDVYARHQGIHHGEHGFHVEHHHRLLVVWRDVVGGLDGLLHLLFHVGHLHARLHGEAHELDGVAQVVHLLHRGIGQGDGFGSLSLYVDVALGRAHAHHAIVDAVYLYVLAAGVTSLGEEALVDTLADDAHLACFADVYVVDEASVGHFLMLYLFVVGVEPFDATIVFVALVDGRFAPLGYRGSGNLYGGQFADALHVGHFEVPASSFAEAFVGLARLLGEDEARVGGKTFEFFTQLLLHALAASHEGHEHEDAPEYAEGREQASRLVAGDGDEDFLAGIFVYFHNA